MENKCFHFCIAEHGLFVDFSKCEDGGLWLIPSFLPFKMENIFSGKIFFKMDVWDGLGSHPIQLLENIGTFDTGNGKIAVNQIKGTGGYQYDIKNFAGKDCCLLQANHDFSQAKCKLFGNRNMRCFGLNTALMLVFAFRGSQENTLLIHASSIRCEGKGYAFVAKSGTGKSTQSSFWLRYIRNCDLINDDNPILRLQDDKVFLYGSPWSGKTPCYRNVKVELCGIAKIKRAKSNSIEKNTPLVSFAFLMSSCSSMKWDHNVFTSICKILSDIISKTNIYTLNCLPNKESALLCHKTFLK